MLDALTDLMGAVPATASYAEARHVLVEEEELALRNGSADRVRADRTEGVGIRVRVAGAWGFAATADLSRASLLRALQQAVAIAVAQPRALDLGRLGPQGPPARGHWDGPCEQDPLALSVEARLDHLAAAEAALRAAGDPRLAVTSARCTARRITQAFASTEGAACTQVRTETGGGLQAVAADGDDVQIRSYPTSHDADVAAAGWEHVLGLDLLGHAPRVAAEALELLTAPPCPARVTDLVLHPEQLALQVHESIGHALELDRILLGEASYAGASWVTAADLAPRRPGGPLRYGSPALSITADATLPGGLGTYGWDDEGTPATRTSLVVEGLLVGVLSDRGSAAQVGLERSGACARADGFARQPIVRMTNVSIEPGDAGTLADIVADTDDGLYLESNRSWSIDDRRLQFQFGCEVAREIRGGELGRLYRDPVYAGITPRFWGSLDAVGSAASWGLQGLTNCGKGEPGQVMAVSHGVAPARFRGVEVRPA